MSYIHGKRVSSDNLLYVEVWFELTHTSTNDHSGERERYWGGTSYKAMEIDKSGIRQEDTAKRP